MKYEPLRAGHGQIYIGDGEYMEMSDLKRFLKEAGYRIIKIRSLKNTDKRIDILWEINELVADYTDGCFGGYKNKEVLKEQLETNEDGFLNQLNEILNKI